MKIIALDWKATPSRKWKALLIALAGGAMLLFISVQILVARPSSATPQAVPAVSAPDLNGEPTSNEIKEFQQQG